ncbi:MAG: peptide ABC transporter substrate-binding protein [Leucobacter sp.]
MKRSRIGLGIVALAAAGSLALTGCSTGGGDKGGDKGSGSAFVTTNGSEPESGLIPSDTNEVGGGKILDVMFAGLVSYSADGTPANELAESIEANADSTEFTIKIKGGTKFTNGDPVTAESFTKAWNDAAQASNARKNQSWFSNIQGFNETEDSELTGLEVVDDTTFVVKLNAPQADFPLQLGYSSFYPLPAVAFDDKGAVTKEFGEAPVGNGMYKLADEKAWQHDVQIELVKNEDYAGPRKVENDGLTIIFYASQDAAYVDLQDGKLDVLDAVPESAFASYETDLDGRTVNQPAAIVQTFTIPETFEHFSGEEGKLRRQAISMSFDREEITDVIFDGTRTPAVDFTSPVINGWSDDLKNVASVKYDPEQAKKLWAEADAIAPWSGSLEIAYNGDGGHQGWVDAVTNSVKNTLGIEASGKPYATFQEIRTEVTGRTIKTAFRTGWQADYPGLYNFLAPLYQTGASSNDGDYSNPEFDKLLAEGLAESDVEAANAKFEAAQEILLQDLPAIPLWYSNVVGGFGTDVDNVTFGWNSVPLYNEITKK